MTPRQLGLALEAISWSPADLARHLQCSAMPVRMMLSGERPIEPELAAWLEGLVAAVKAAPSLPDRRFRP